MSRNGFPNRFLLYFQSPIKEEHGSNGSVSTIEMLETNRSLMFNRLTELITPTIQNVVEFAKRIPGKNIIAGIFSLFIMLSL